MPRRPLRICVLIGVAVTLAAYARAPEVGFFFDDRQNIELAAGVHWTELSAEAMRGLRDSTLLPQRVVANATFGLNHLVGGLDPWGYHVVNIVVHLGVGLTLTWVAWLYLLAVLPGKDRDSLALAAALPVVVFLVHPLNTQAVTYVVQRMSSLAALFSLLAFGAFLVGRSKPRVQEAWRWYALAAIWWMLAVGSKENALALPLVLVTYEVGFHPAAWQRWWKTRRPGERTWLVGLVGVGVVGGMGLVVASLGRWPMALTQEWPQRDFNGWERVLTQLRVQVFYLGLLVWPAPSRLNLDHDFAVSRGLLEPTSTMAAGFFWIGVVLSAAVLTKRHPRYGFPILAYVEWHLIEAGPVNLELVFEHRMYLPMTMLVLLAAVVLAERVEQWRRLALVASVVVVVPLAWGTWQRNQIWADAEAFYRDTARKSPGKQRPWYNLGTQMLKWNRPEDAVEPLERAVRADSTDWRTTDQLGLAYLGVGRTDDALETFRRAARLEPGVFEPELHIGRALELRGSTTEAARHLFDLGTRRGMAGDVMMAMLALQRAVELDSTNSAAHNALGNVYLLAGRPQDALEQYRRAVSLDPTNLEAVFNAGMAMADHGDATEALVLLERFVAAAPAWLAPQARTVRARIEELKRRP